MNLKWRLCMIVILLTLSFGVCYMNNHSYKMAVFVTPENENDHEWPNKKKWIDASEWLRTSQYVKIDDFHLLNLHYTPVDNLNTISITARIQEAIDNSGNSIPELSVIGKLDSQSFLQLMDGNLSYEYLRTEMDNESFKPVNDYFLVFFLYKEKKYEVELIRVVYNGKLIFMTYGSVVRYAGYWHSISPAAYSYKDFKDGRTIK